MDIIKKTYAQLEHIQNSKIYYDLWPFISTLLATCSKSNKSLINYLNTAGVAVQLQSL